MQSEAPKIHVSDFCLAIQNLEGYFPPCAKFPKGSSAYHNKNPGNIKCQSVTHSTAIGCNGPFCVFKDYATGFAALEHNIVNVVKGNAKKYGYYPEMTLLQFFEHRDPKPENNPDQCALNVARYLHCSVL